MLLLTAAVGPTSAARLRAAGLSFGNTRRAPALANPQATRALTNAVAYFLQETHRFEVLSAEFLGGSLLRQLLRDRAPEWIQRMAQELKLDYVIDLRREAFTHTDFWKVVGFPEDEPEGRPFKAHTELG